MLTTGSGLGQTAGIKQLVSRPASAVQFIHRDRETEGDNYSQTPSSQQSLFRQLPHFWGSRGSAVMRACSVARVRVPDSVMRVKFVVGSCPRSEGFSLVFLPPKNQHFQIPIRPGNSGEIPFYLLFYFLWPPYSLWLNLRYPLLYYPVPSF